MIFQKDDRQKAGEQLQQQAFGENQQSFRSTIAKTAMSMAAFGIGMVVAKGAVTGVSRALGRIVTTGSRDGGFIAKAFGSTGNNASSRFVAQMRRATERIDRIATRRERLTGQSGANAAVRADYRLGNIIAHTDAYRSSSLGGAVKRAEALDRARYGAEGKLWKPNKLHPTNNAPFTQGQIMRSRGYRYVKESGYGMAVGLGMYAMETRGDKAAGPWYSPGNLAAFATTFVAGDVVFRGAMPLAKKMASGALSSAPGNAFQASVNRSARSHMTGMLEALEKVNFNALKAATAAIQTTGATVRASKGHDFNDRVGRTILAAKTFKEHYAIHREIGKQHSEDVKTGAFMQRTIASVATGLTNNTREHRQDRALGDGTPGNSVVFRKTMDSQARRIFKDALGDFSDKSRVGNLPKIFRALTGDSSVTHGTIRFRVGDPIRQEGSSTEIMTGIRSTGVPGEDAFRLYKGKGIVSHEGRSYDLSGLYPSQMIGAAVEFLGATIKPFGHSATSLLNIASIAKLGSWQEGYSQLHAGNNINLSRRYPVPDFLKHNQSLGHNDELLDSIGAAVRSLDNVGETTSRSKTDVSNYFDPTRRREWAASMMEFRAPGDGAAATRAEITHKTAMNLDHGSFTVAKGETVHYVAGRLYLEQAGKNKSNFYALGINPRSGEQMRYKSLPIVKGSTFAAVHDKLMGGEAISYTGYDGNTESYHAGYGSPYRIERADTSTAQTFWREIRRAFDLGGKSEPTLPTKVVNWFKALKDPTEERIMFSRQAMEGFHIDQLNGASHKSVNTYGARVTGQAASLNAATFADIYSNAELMGVTKQYLQGAKPEVRDVADLLLTNGEVLAMSSDRSALAERASRMFAFVENNEDLGSIAKNSITRVAGILENQSRSTSNQPHALELFHQFTKIGHRNDTLSTLDEANRAILNFAFKSADQGELTGLSQTLMSRSYSPHQNMIGNIRLLQQTADAATGTFENLFKGENPEMMGQKQGVVSQLMSVLSGNGSAVDSFMKKIRPLWKMGSRDTDYISPQVAGVRSRLFIAEDTDVGGNKLVKRGSFHHSNTPNADHLMLPKQATEYDAVSLKTYMSGASIEAVNNVANMVGLGFSADVTKDWSSFAQNMLAKRVTPALAMMYAWRGLDAFTDDSGMFDNTALSEGLNVFVATQFEKARLASARILDASGFTDFAQKAEDLMPGSINSPLMGAVRGIGAPILGASLGMKFGNPLAGGVIGGIVGLLTAGGPLASMGMYDVTKSRGQLIEEYSGRKKVPYVGDKGWLVGSNPMSGSNVDGWVPGFYARMRAQYQYTPTTFGSKFERMLEPIMPGSIEEKNMRNRPYPLTGGAFGRRPLSGNILAVGRKELYEQELDDWGALPGLEISGMSMGFGNSSMDLPIKEQKNSDVGNVLTGMDNTFVGNSYTLADKPAISPGSVFGRANETFYRGTEFLGLRGFLMQAAYKKMSGTQGASAAPFGDMPQLADGSIMTSSANWFWDQAIGDPLGMTEFIRRLYPPMSNKGKINPLPNTQADWLPEKFQVGDPYRVIPLGEIRLPGAGFETVNDVEYSMPGEVDLWSPDAAETASNYLFGKRDTAVQYALKNFTKEKIARTLTQTNTDVQLDASYFNAGMDLSGTADVVGGGNIYKIQVVGDETFSNLSGMTYDVEGKLQMLGALSGNKSGTAVYVNQSTGETKTYYTSMKQDQAMEAIKSLQEGRATAAAMLGNAKMAPNFNLGNAYSRMDRLKILNDIAPQSKEFFDTLKQVESLNKYHKSFDYENNMENLQKMNFISQQPGKMYPYRFTNLGDSQTDIAYKNEVASEYSLPERMIGGAWEKVAHTNSIINKKFLNITSPYEAYARNEVYGRTIKLWDKPYQHFIKPYAAQVAGSTDVMDNSRSLATTGFVFGGPVGGVVGGAVGGVISSFNSITSDYSKVPEYRIKERDINQVMDMVSYRKNAQRYAETGDPMYLSRQQQSMTYANNNLDTISLKDYERALPFSEKKYFESMSLTMGSEERSKILNTLPEAVKPGMQKMWNNYSMDKQDSQYMTEFGQNIMEKSLTPDWGGWFTGNDDNLVKIKMMNNYGLDARDVGVGWNSQMEQLAKTPLLQGRFDAEFKTSVSAMKQSIEAELMNAFGNRVTVNVAPSVGPTTMVSIVLG